MKDYPWNTPYAFAENDVIRSIDVEGLEKLIIINNKDKYGRLESVTLRGLRSIEVKTAIDVELQKATGGNYTTRDILIINRQAGKPDEVSYDDMNAQYANMIKSAPKGATRLDPNWTDGPNENMLRVDQRIDGQNLKGTGKTNVEFFESRTVYQRGTRISATPNYANTTTTSTTTSSLDISFLPDKAAFNGDGAKAISEYIAKLPPGTLSVNVVVATSVADPSTCMDKGWFGSCNYDIHDLIDDRIKLVSTYFKKDGIAFTFTPNFGMGYKVVATSTISTTATTPTVTSWNVTKQAIVRKVVNGKVVGPVRTEGGAKQSTSTTKPKAGDIW